MQTSRAEIMKVIQQSHLLLYLNSPLYNHHGWLGVKNQLSIYVYLKLGGDDDDRGGGGGGASLLSSSSIIITHLAIVWIFSFDTVWVLQSLRQVKKINSIVDQEIWKRKIMNYLHICCVFEFVTRKGYQIGWVLSR